MQSKLDFTFSLFGGIIGILGTVFWFLSKSFISSSGSYRISSIEYLMILFSVIISTFLIISAFLMKSKSKFKLGAILSLIFGVLLLPGYTFFGGIFGIIGGFIGLKNSKESYNNIKKPLTNESQIKTNNLAISEKPLKKYFWIIKVIYILFAVGIFTLFSGVFVIGTASPASTEDRIISLIIFSLGSIFIFLIGYVGFVIEKKSKIIWIFAFIIGLLLFSFGVYKLVNFLIIANYFYLIGFLISIFIPLLFGIMPLFVLMNSNMIRYYFDKNTKKVLIISYIFVFLDFIITLFITILIRF